MQQDYHKNTIARFDSQDVATEYRQRKNKPTRRNLREWECIRSALAGVPAGSTVLDLPCGSGRLEPRLEDLGYRVTAADSSPHMLDMARSYYREQRGSAEIPDTITFTEADVMATGFADGAFDAVICNRLLHHYPTSELRRRALTELARISKGVVVISFFSNFSLSALRFHLKYRLRRKKPWDRIPISIKEMNSDIEAAGLRTVERFSVRYGMSPQTYLLLEKR